MQDPLPPFRHVAILGVGLLGGSIGLALRRNGFTGPGRRITGFGHRQSSLDAATAAGAIDAGFLDLSAAAAGADLVILASPIGLFEGMLRDLGKIWGGTGSSSASVPPSPTLPRKGGGSSRPEIINDVIITDVGSTKRQVVAWAKRLLPKAVRFVGSHPIAGSDKRGVQYARADLFDGACCVITPSPPLPVIRERDGVRVPPVNPFPLGEGRVRVSRDSTSESYAEAVAQIDRFWQALGMWTIRLAPAVHDRYLAEISHLPHATAAALMLLSDPSAQELAGTGFLDSTRIAGGDPELWRDIFLTNAAEVVRAIKGLSRKLDRLAGLIAKADDKGLVKFLADAQQRRVELMNRKLKRRRVEG